jgi:hypothetical protein
MQELQNKLNLKSIITTRLEDFPGVHPSRHFYQSSMLCIH